MCQWMGPVPAVGWVVGGGKLGWLGGIKLVPFAGGDSVRLWCENYIVLGWDMCGWGGMDSLGWDGGLGVR